MIALEALQESFYGAGIKLIIRLVNLEDSTVGLHAGTLDRERHHKALAVLAAEVAKHLHL